MDNPCGLMHLERRFKNTAGIRRVCGEIVNGQGSMSMG